MNKHFDLVMWEFSSISLNMDNIMLFILNPLSCRWGQQDLFTLWVQDSNVLTAEYQTFPILGHFLELFEC